MQQRTSSALLSVCGQYRYSLVRRWEEGGTNCLWIMLNPSTADEMKDDPTVRKCVTFSKRWGHSAMEVVNLYAWRATSPGDLPEDYYKAVGPRSENNAQICRALRSCHAVVVAWGAHGANPRLGEVLFGTLHCGNCGVAIGKYSI